MLKRVEIKSFKSLLDVSVELGVINVFIGANGSGKSNLLEAIRALMERMCRWLLEQSRRQLLLTCHNPLVLDGLPLQDERVRLFAVDRSAKGRTLVKRIEVDAALLEKAKEGWPLSRLWIAGHLGGVPDV